MVRIIKASATVLYGFMTPPASTPYSGQQPPPLNDAATQPAHSLVIFAAFKSQKEQQTGAERAHVESEVVVMDAVVVDAVAVSVAESTVVAPALNSEIALIKLYT